MAASGHGRRGGIVGAWSIFVLVTWLFALCKIWKLVVAEGVEIAMADRGHLGQECQCARLLHGQNIGGRGAARPNAEGEDPGENWFRLENSVEETRVLMRLEGELNATLMFKHGGRQLASTL